MTTQTFKGSCHCGNVRFEADLDFDKGTGKCNCSFCSKIRHWGMLVKPDAFRLIAGEDSLTDYQHGTKSIHHYFCKVCGVRGFAKGHLEMLGGDFYVVQIAALDGVPDKVLAELKVGYSDGRSNAWQNRPEETRHL